MRPWAVQKVKLTRYQIERMAVYLALNSLIQEITIEEHYNSGIGASHRAVYHTGKIERDWEEEITDVSNW